MCSRREPSTWRGIFDSKEYLVLRLCRKVTRRKSDENRLEARSLTPQPLRSNRCVPAGNHLPAENVLAILFKFIAIPCPEGDLPGVMIGVPTETTLAPAMQNPKRD